MKAEVQKLQKYSLEKFLNQVGQATEVLRQELVIFGTQQCFLSLTELGSGWITEQRMEETLCYISFISLELSMHLIQNNISKNICGNKKRIHE